MPASVALTFEPAHHLAALGGGAWQMTGSDPQFIVRGPFERGLWEWRMIAERQTAAAQPAVQIYYAPNGEFNESASVRFAALPDTPREYRLRFWLPAAAAFLRFDPADAPGVVKIGDARGVRLGRGPAVWKATRDHLRAHGARSLVPWLRRAAAAAAHGAPAVRKVMLDFVLEQDAPDRFALVDGIVAARAARYPVRPEAGLFSILTTVYDTPAAYLRELADSVRRQSWDAFEWIVLDNGTSRPETRRELAAIARDPRVTLVGVERNLGIIGGMRAVLERARGRYVLPVDSDDYLFPDALAILASVAQRHDYPAILYSDEDKLRDGRHVDAFHKPDWDPVLFRNCCYIAHLCAIGREDALRLGIYSDPRAEGCHDWDTFLRFSRDRLAPIHVPEVIYSWRMHGGSTAANVDAKDYVVNSQRHVLDTHLAAAGLRDRFTVERSPLFPASPDWWIRRRRVDPLPVALVVTGAEQAPKTLAGTSGAYPITSVIEAHEAPIFRALHYAASNAALVVIADAAIAPHDDEWLWEMAGLKESFADALIVAGRIIDTSGVIIDGPGNGSRADDPGAFGIALKQRTTTSFTLRLAAFDGGWLRSLETALFDGLPPAALEDALRRAAGVHGRIVTSPFITAAGAAKR